jgi:hypothetical protein
VNEKRLAWLSISVRISEGEIVDTISSVDLGNSIVIHPAVVLKDYASANGTGICCLNIYITDVAAPKRGVLPAAGIALPIKNVTINH